MKVLLYEYLKRPTRFTKFLYNYRSIFEASNINIVTTGKVDFVIVDCQSLKTKASDAFSIWDELQDSRGGGKLYVLIDDGRFFDKQFVASDWYGTPIIGIGKHSGFLSSDPVLPSADERVGFFTMFTPFVYDYRLTDITIGSKPVDISIAKDVDVPDSFETIYQRVNCNTNSITEGALLTLKNSKYFVCSFPNLDLMYHAIRFGTVVLIKGTEPVSTFLTDDILKTDYHFFDDWKALQDMDCTTVKVDTRVGWNDEQARSKFLAYWVKFLKQI